MLSFGTEVFFAFWMASKSVGLAAGSPPPVRAATSMFLISLANILPRLASMTAFLCFVVAHLEWPLMTVPPFVSRACRAPPAHTARGPRGLRCGGLPDDGTGRDPTPDRPPGVVAHSCLDTPVYRRRRPRRDGVSGPV